MVLKKIDLSEVPDEFRALLAELKTHTQIVVMDGDIPIARLLPAQSDSRPERIFGLAKGAFVMADNFDDDLPDSFWLGDDE